MVTHVFTPSLENIWIYTLLVTLDHMFVMVKSWSPLFPFHFHFIIEAPNWGSREFFMPKGFMSTLGLLMSHYGQSCDGVKYLSLWSY